MENIQQEDLFLNENHFGIGMATAEKCYLFVQIFSKFQSHIGVFLF